MNYIRSTRRPAATAAFSILALLALSFASQAGAVRPPSPARELDNLELLLEPVPEYARYYILIFGSQSTPKRPRQTHTWATMVKTEERPGEPPLVCEVYTISWTPASGIVRPMRFRVETGKNLDLWTSVAGAKEYDKHIALWGPYETWQGLYRRFVTQSEFLSSGGLGYQCIDGFGESARMGNGCNCFHAISDMDPEFDRRQYPLFFYGNAASANIVRQIMTRPILIHPCVTHDWLIEALGLCPSQFTQKRYRGPVVEFSPEAIRTRSSASVRVEW